MSISIRLITLSLLSIILTFAMFATIANHDKTRANYHERIEKVARIQLYIGILRTHFNTHERYSDLESIQNAIRQQEQLHNELLNFTQASGDEQIYLQSIHHLNTGIQYLFSDMLAAHEHKHLNELETATHFHLLDRLNNSLLSMSEDGFRLARHALLSSQKLGRQGTQYIALLLSVLALITTALALRTLMIFRVSISHLRSGIETASQGDLQHQIRMPVQNEISELADDFNNMKDHLRASMISVDSLQHEVSIRTRELEEQKEILKKIAEHDSLTGLPNRGYFLQQLKHSLNRCERNQCSAAIFFLDLDKFKQINDSLGHDIGDAVLQEMTRRFTANLRKSDFLARIGGDEFTIIAEPLPHNHDAATLAGKLLQSLQPPCEINGHTLYLHSSIGISIYPEDGRTPLELMKNADSAMYQAKQAGGDNFYFYNRAVSEAALCRIQLENDLRHALKNQELEVYYQPQFNLLSTELSGIEALVRWNHPKQGMIPPDKFISLAEEKGLIFDLGEQVIELAFTQFSRWQQEHSIGLLAINISAMQLNRGDLAAIIEEKLRKHGLSAYSLELEITESYLIQEPEKAIRQLNELRHMGIQISVDDFGTGYSSLAYLKRLPLSRLKIDKSFVDGIVDKAEDRAICTTIIALAKSLQLKVIAEGVETAEQAHELRLEGCDQVQGYLYSKPLSSKEFEKRFLRLDLEVG